MSKQHEDGWRTCYVKELCYEVNGRGREFEKITGGYRSPENRVAVNESGLYECHEF